MGGAFLAQALAAELDVEFFFTEPVSTNAPGLFAARYRLLAGLERRISGQRVAIVDDVISAGSSVRATAGAVTAAGGTVVVVGALLTLGAVGLDHFSSEGIPVESLGQRSFAMWPPTACPLCAADVPLEDPVEAVHRSTKAPPTILPTKDGYDRWSEIYDADDNPLVLLEEPLVANVLGDVNGLSMLDVGCGTGRHAIRFAALGARVVGVDFSPGMLARARAKPGAHKVTFIEHDISTPLPFEAAAFDRVISCLVLDHVEHLVAFFSELRRVCRPGGFVVTSVIHPAMMLKGTQARFTDPETGTELRPASATHQLSDYVMGAAAAGLRVDDMSEHVVDDRLAARTARAGKYLGWPLLLLMRLTPAPGRGGTSG
jgi:malonyl-CoA O-methyltransferase